MTTFAFSSKRLDDTGIVEVAAYGDGSIALRLVGLDGVPLLIPTVNLQEYGEKPAPGNVFIKNYNENTGVFDTLSYM